MSPEKHTPPKQGEPGFGRDEALESTRGRQRPAKADLSSDEAKAGQKPTIEYAPDPDADDEVKATPDY